MRPTKEVKNAGDFEDRSIDESNNEDPNPRDESKNNEEGQLSEDDHFWQTHELPPEVALQGEWEAEEEAARWLQAADHPTEESIERETVLPTDPQGYVGAGDHAAQLKDQSTKRGRSAAHLLENDISKQEEKGEKDPCGGQTRGAGRNQRRRQKRGGRQAAPAKLAKRHQRLPMASKRH